LLPVRGHAGGIYHGLDLGYDNVGSIVMDVVPGAIDDDVAAIRSGDHRTDQPDGAVAQVGRLTGGAQGH
jgi:hypothetical protein